MNYILQALTQETVLHERREADNTLFLSQRNYLGVEVTVAAPPEVTQQYGALAGLVTVIDGNNTIKLAPGEVYDGGTRFVS